MNKNILFTGVILVIGVIYLAMAQQMPLGSVAYPGPGFYPSAVGIFLVLSAAVCLGLAVLEAKKDRSAGASAPPNPPKSPKSPKSNNKALGITPMQQLVALLLLYVASLPYLGFHLDVSIFLLLALRIFGYRNWQRSIAITAVIVAVSHFTFVYWLSVPLPRGILDAYL